MNNNYSKAYVEVLEILKYIPKEEMQKIPDDILKTLTKKSDSNYSFKLDFNIPFESQKLLNETKSILANFFRDYWATDFQREQILIKEKQDRQNQIESEKFDYDKLFKKNESGKINEDRALVVQKENRRWYTFFMDFIKRCFNKK